MCLGRERTIIAKSDGFHLDGATTTTTTTTTTNANIDNIQAYREHMRQVERKIPDVDLMVPGRIVHFVKSHRNPKGCCFNEQMYLPVWASPADFQEVRGVL